MDEPSSSEDDAADRDVVESERRATPPGAVDEVDAIEEDEPDDDRSAEEDASSLDAAAEAALLALPRSAFIGLLVGKRSGEGDGERSFFLSTLVASTYFFFRFSVFVSLSSTTPSALSSRFPAIATEGGENAGGRWLRDVFASIERAFFFFFELSLVFQLQ